MKFYSFFLLLLFMVKMAVADDHNDGGGYGAGEVREDSKSSHCSDYADDGYECVPFDLCEEGEIIVDGGGLIDPRSGLLDAEGSKCEGYLDVCCRHPERVGEPVHGKTTTVYKAPKTTTPYKPPTTTSPPYRPPTTTKPPYRPPTTTRPPYRPPTTTRPPYRPPTTTRPPYESQCGQRNQNGVTVRILNAKSTQFGEWPNMCAVTRELPGENDGYGGQTKARQLYVGGASLVAPGVVITAAHRVQNLKPEHLVVRCGEWDTQRDVEPLKHQDKRVDKVFIHPQYDNSSLAYDIAVIIMEEAFDLNRHLDVACLPMSYDDFDTEGCFATGWGKDDFGAEGRYQVVLKQVELDLVGKKKCQHALRKTRLGKNFRLHNTFTCAGGEKGVDTCQGDGGSPLMCPAKGSTDGYGNRAEPAHYVQAGIVAWGVGCGEEGVPGVYVDVASTACFIDFAHKCYFGDHIEQYADKCHHWGQNLLEKQLEPALVKYERALDKTYDERKLWKIKKIVAKLKEQIRRLTSFQCNTQNPYGNSDDGGDDEHYDDQPDVSGLVRNAEDRNKEDGNEARMGGTDDNDDKEEEDSDDGAIVFG